MNWEIVKSGFVAAWTAVAGVAGHRTSEPPKPVAKPKPAKEVKAPATKPNQGKVVRSGNRAFMIERPSVLRFVGEEISRREGNEVRVMVIRSSTQMSQDVKIYVHRG